MPIKERALWIVLLILLILLVLGELYTLALRCRRGHPDWKYLRLWRYAHRGYHDKPIVPENSMAAFRRAVEHRFGAELDVHLLRDGRLAVIHDSSLRRTAGADVEVEDLTAEELKQYRLEGTDETVPLLEEVLALFEDQTPLIVELKPARGNHDELTAAAVALLDRYRVRYCMESFNPRCLMWLRRNRPEIARGQLSEQFLRRGGEGQLSKLNRFILGNLLMNFLTVPDFIAYRYQDRKCLSVRWCRRFYRVQEVNWTITDRDQMADAERDKSLVIFERFDPKGEQHV
ncbi:MAG: glycerophosphodiester phosphodiesterase [Ruminococcaceae bacterium]|jgi:glycerophosphoryl diester phosphodiesterase|nr:glycerophosphodiester phosphodiesterase [Oscillospiraceae bacterium]